MQQVSDVAQVLLPQWLIHVVPSLKVLDDRCRECLLAGERT
jgi:hypothetical protein